MTRGESLLDHGVTVGPCRFPRKLTSAELELTTACPCRCVTCGSSAGPKRSVELEGSEWLDVVDQLAALGCRQLSLLGGEPLLRPDWPAVARAAVARGMEVELLTSGVGVTEGVAELARSAGLRSVTVSVDGTEEAHDAQRRLAGCYRAAIDAIGHFDRAGLIVGVTTQVNPQSLGTLEALAPLLEAAGAWGWQLQLTLPMGRAGGEEVLRVDQMVELHALLVRLALRPRLRPVITDNIGYWTSDDPWLRTAHGSRVRCFLGCIAGIRHVGITSDGRVKGCLALPDHMSEGSVHERSLRSIFDDANAFAYTRGSIRLSGACARCEHQDFCRGGCMAAAAAFHGHVGENARCLRLHVPPNQPVHSARVPQKEPVSP
jgi:radical SAM protein with 4Fe4S-binding SPASM domain